MPRKKKPKISKLFSLREWLTVPEASRHLSVIFDEEITEAQILRLSLDNHLKLSVNFVNHARARCGQVVSEENAVWEEYPPDSLFAQVARTANRIHNKQIKIDKKKPLKVLKSQDLGDGRFLNLSNRITSIEGVWDLCMLGNEHLDIEHQYQMLTGGPEVTLTCLDGVFVEREDGEVYVLQESFDENDLQEGSAALLEKLKEYIKINNIEKDKAKELLNQHKQAREKYLKKRNERDPLEDYYPAGGLPRDSVLVVRTQALIELQNRLMRPKFKDDSALDPRSERTYLNVIGSLLEITTGTFKDESFKSETQLRDFIAEKFDDLRGVSTRNTADIFAAAKRALNNELD